MSRYEREITVPNLTAIRISWHNVQELFRDARLVQSCRCMYNFFLNQLRVDQESLTTIRVSSYFNFLSHAFRDPDVKTSRKNNTSVVTRQPVGAENFCQLKASNGP
jgi:hypothetical protein